MSASLYIVDYGSDDLRAVKEAFAHVGAASEIGSEPHRLRSAAGSMRSSRPPTSATPATRMRWPSRVMVTRWPSSIKAARGPGTNDSFAYTDIEITSVEPAFFEARGKYLPCYLFSGTAKYEGEAILFECLVDAVER